jgi:hypothetical protein
MQENLTLFSHGGFGALNKDYCGQRERTGSIPRKASCGSLWSVPGEKDSHPSVFHLGEDI